MIIKKNIFLSFIVAMTLVGCGSDDANDENDAAVSEVAAKLEAAWRGDCTIDTEGREFGSSITTLSFSVPSLIRSATEYSDDLCSTRNGNFPAAGLNVSIGNASGTTTGSDGLTYAVYPLDITKSDGSEYHSISLQENDTKLLLAIEAGENDGSTSAKRTVEFTGAEIFSKQ